MGKMNRIQAILRQVDLENHSSKNWERIHEAPQCGCYYCTQVFSSSEVNDFEETETGEKGAVCPYCGRKTLVTPDMIVAGVPFSAETMRGISEAMKHVRQGHPLGFFPAGAVSKFTRQLHIEDREWQPTVCRLIQKLKVPVIPIYFHGHNSLTFTILGMIDWRLRTLKLPSEVFRRKGDTFRISVESRLGISMMCGGAM